MTTQGGRSGTRLMTGTAALARARTLARVLLGVGGYTFSTPRGSPT